MAEHRFCGPALVDSLVRTRVRYEISALVLLFCGPATIRLYRIDITVPAIHDKIKYATAPLWFMGGHGLVTVAHFILMDNANKKQP